jgi:hypothetical protein
MKALSGAAAALACNASKMVSAIGTFLPRVPVIF